jgi:hypothetical protein
LSACGIESSRLKPDPVSSHLKFFYAPLWFLRNLSRRRKFTKGRRNRRIRRVIKALTLDNTPGVAQLLPQKLTSSHRGGLFSQVAVSKQAL